MRKVIGVGCIVLGLVCLMISVGFIVYNQYEADRGEKASQELLQNMQASMPEAQPKVDTQQAKPQDLEEPVIPEMQTVPVGS